ncbi:dipeptidase PepE [Aestuariibacter salexigens]|uniref:dipeptidase PepE n=1 Tax=Aestuariibacter salexigens TaxID=226010 RepID=UPI0004277D9B|nr:dipeptidase PepE [Aestuariibacter salexigens]
MLSSSRRGNEEYLEHAVAMFHAHLGDVKRAIFVPFAGVSIGWDDYTDKVQRALPDLEIRGLHQCADKQQAVMDADAIMVGGGNTFNLLNELYVNNLIEPLKKVALRGTPYIGWSAGSNICGNSIRTTNDMPIIQPPSFEALNLVPFQLNPHYTDYIPPGHNGETRAERISEFCTLEPNMPVIGIREGTALQRKGDSLTLLGAEAGVMFLDKSQSAIAPGQDLSHLLNIN